MSAADLIAKALSKDLLESAGQEQPTEEFVIPAMPAIIAFATGVRKQMDESHRGLPAMGYGMEKRPGDPASEYPVGFCKTICLEVFAKLSRSEVIRGLVKRGVVFKTVYIILYGRYFQNAIQIGNVYLDAANDTVDPRKPFLEWMHIRDLDYRNLGSWEQVIAVAEGYFGCRAVPNREFPLLSPFVPFYAIRGDGKIELVVFQDSFFLKDLGDGFARYIEWISKCEGASARSLSPGDLGLLEKAFGSNDFGNFPFEFSPAANDGLIEQARQIHAASTAAGGGEVIRKFIELGHLAARDFNKRGLVSSRAADIR